MKILSPKLTAICMERRDELNKNANKLLEEAQVAFEKTEQQCKSLMYSAKTLLHDAKIESNRMKKEAAIIQEALQEELELEIKAEQEAMAAWEPKSEAHLNADLRADDLIELMKKVQ